MALTTSSSTQLGCGRDIDQVWDHLGSAPDAHELTCPYCQGARADLAGLASATQAMRDDDASNPDLEPSPGVLDRILAVARTEVRRGRRLPLDQPGPEQTSPNTVSQQAVSAVVRRVGDRTRQVQIRRCDLAQDKTSTRSEAQPSRLVDTATTSESGPPNVSHGVSVDDGPAAVAVSLRVSVARDLPIAAVSNQLRAAIIEAIQQEVGMHVASVDITVEDLHDA